MHCLNPYLIIPLTMFCMLLFTARTSLLYYLIEYLCRKIRSAFFGDTEDMVILSIYIFLSWGFFVVMAAPCMMPLKITLHLFFSELSFVSSKLNFLAPGYFILSVFKAACAHEGHMCAIKLNTTFVLYGAHIHEY